MMSKTNPLPPNWAAHKDKLNQIITRPRWGLLTDVDGTISEIVDVPDDARVSDSIRKLLAGLAEHAAVVAAISGRSAGDIRHRVGLPQLVYIGNHGFERWTDDRAQPVPEVEPYLPALAAVRRVIEQDAPEGMWVEDKGATLSVHYRQTADPAAVKAGWRPRLQSLAKTHALDLFGGRMVFELRPPLNLNKGTAAVQLIDEFDLDGTLFLGDDVTDVDAMRALQRRRENHGLAAAAIGVVSPDMPPQVAAAADFLAGGVSGVEALLAWLLAAVRAS